MADIFRPPLVVNRREPGPYKVNAWVGQSLLLTTLAVVAAVLPPGQQATASSPALQRSVVDTSHGTPKPLLADAQLPFLVLQQTPPDRQRPVVDTTHGTAKTLIADAQAPVGQQPAFAPIALTRTVVDTSRGQPITLQVIVPPAPFFVLPHQPPAKSWWQPADSTHGTPKTLTADAQLPVQNLQLTPPDRVRPVVDTSQSTPESLLPVAAVPLPIGQASFVGLQRFWHQPPDTSQSTQRTLDSVPLPVGQASFVGLQRFWFQPADTSQSSPKVTYGDMQLPAGQSPAFAPIALVRNVVDTSQSAYGASQAFVNIPVPPGAVLPPILPRWAWQNGDTTQESPPVAIQGVQPAPPPPDVTPLQGGGGRLVRRRHYIEIDGEIFPVKNIAEAEKILREVKKLARQVAPKVAAKVVEAEKPVAVPVVTMPVPLPDMGQLQAKIDAANNAIQAIYAKALQQAIAKAREQDDEDVITMLLLS
jgi:hypothetical protein